MATKRRSWRNGAKKLALWHATDRRPPQPPTLRTSLASAFEKAKRG